MDGKKTITKMLIVLVLLVLFAGCSNRPSNLTTAKPASPNKVSPNKTSTASSKQQVKEKIWKSALIDANGDGVKEKVELTSKQTAGDSGYFSGEGLTLNISNIGTGKSLTTQKVFTDASGIFPEFVTGDLNQDGAEEILACMNSGGNGYGYTYFELYSFKNNRLKKIPFDNILSEKEKYIHFIVLEADKVSLKVRGLKENYTVPLSRYQQVLYKKIKSKDKWYNDREFGYFAGAFLEIDDYDKDGYKELKCSKMFIAEYHSEIAKVDIVYKYRSGWQPVSFKVDPIYKSKSASDRAKVLHASDLRLAKLKSGLTLDQVLEIMGQPAGKDGTIGTELTYSDGTRLYICPVVNHIEIKSSNYPTPRGLVVGDSKEKVRDLYGEPDEDTSDDLGESWQYWTDDLDYLSIKFKKGKVDSMVIDTSNSLRD